MGSVGEEKSGSGREFVEFKEFLLLSYVSMVSFGKFFLSLDVFVKLFLSWETYGVNSLKIVIFFFTKPVGG